MSDQIPSPVTPERIELLTSYADGLDNGTGCGNAPLGEWCAKCRDEVAVAIRDLLSALSVSQAAHEKLLRDWREQDRILQEIAYITGDEFVCDERGVLKSVKQFAAGAAIDTKQLREALVYETRRAEKAEAALAAQGLALKAYAAILRQPSDASAFGLETSWLIYDETRAQIADELDRIARGEQGLAVPVAGAGDK